jgi:hypothetical protein
MAHFVIFFSASKESKLIFRILNIRNKVAEIYRNDKHASVFITMFMLCDYYLRVPNLYTVAFLQDPTTLTSCCKSSHKYLLPRCRILNTLNVSRFFYKKRDLFIYLHSFIPLPSDKLLEWYLYQVETHTPKGRGISNGETRFLANSVLTALRGKLQLLPPCIAENSCH